MVPGPVFGVPAYEQMESPEFPDAVRPSRPDGLVGLTVGDTAQRRYAGDVLALGPGSDHPLHRYSNKRFSEMARDKKVFPNQLHLCGILVLCTLNGRG